MIKYDLTFVLMEQASKTPAEALRVKQGLKIREYRTFHKLSQQQLADAVGVSKAAVSMWESGETSPRSTHQIRIAMTLRFPWNVVFGLDGEAA